MTLHERPKRLEAELSVAQQGALTQLVSSLITLAAAETEVQADDFVGIDLTQSTRRHRREITQRTYHYTKRGQKELDLAVWEKNRARRRDMVDAVKQGMEALVDNDVQCAAFKDSFFRKLSHALTKPAALVRLNQIYRDSIYTHDREDVREWLIGLYEGIKLRVMAEVESVVAPSLESIRHATGANVTKAKEGLNICPNDAKLLSGRGFRGWSNLVAKDRRVDPVTRSLAEHGGVRVFRAGRFRRD